MSACKQLTGAATGANVATEARLGGVPFVPIGEGKFLLQGSAQAGGDSAAHFRLRLALGEPVRFFFFARRDLSGGLELSLENAGEEVRLTLRLNHIRHTLNLAEPARALDLRVEIHNDHTDAHILVWRADGPYGDAEDCVSNGECLYNTEFYTFPNPGPWGEQGQGAGIHWGFAGDEAAILLLEGPLEALSNA